MFNKYNLYVYCLWVWILTFAYNNNIIKYSLLYSSFLGLLFTIYSIIRFNKKKIFYTILIVIIEASVLGINIKKHFYIDNKNLFSMRDIFFNIVLFSLYLLFLNYLGITFYELYFIKLKNM